jgi:hypothetical protein
MKNSDAVWHVSLPGQKASGPFSVEQIMANLQAGRLSSAALCWREGMAEWTPLGQIEPFSKAIGAAARPSLPTTPSTQPLPSPPRSSPPPPPVASPPESSGGIVRRLIGYAVAVALLCAAGYVGYVAWAEKTHFDKGKKLLADGEYSEARRLLQNVADNGYIYRQDAGYLALVAVIKEFASNKEEQDADSLRRPKQKLAEILEDSSRRDAVKTDLADLLTCVPAGSLDALPRCLVLADFLMELRLVEGKQIAKELLGKMKQVGERSGEAGGAKLLDTKVVCRIIKEDPALVKDIVAILFANADSKQVPVIIQRLVHEDQTLAQPFGRALMDRADQASKSDRPQEAEQLYNLAGQIEPKLLPEIVKKLLASIKKQVEAKDFAGAITALDKLGNRVSGSGEKPEIASQYLAISKAMSKTNPGVAMECLKKALDADSSLANTEEARWLWIELQPQPSEERLWRCKDFAGKFQKNPLCQQVLVAVLTDGQQLAKQYVDQRDKAIECLSAARVAAEALLAKYADTKELDAQVFELAKRLAEAERKDAAIALANAILKAFPATPLKSDIKAQLSLWILPDGRIPPDKIDDALFVEKNLDKVKINLSQPVALRAILSNPKSVRVIEVSQDCVVAKFASEEKEMLMQWVADGGILWVNNDVLSFFDIQYESLEGHYVCTPAVSPQMCPILDGCGKVAVSFYGQFGDSKAVNLSRANVIPLLSGGGKAVWSLVPYEKGWISDVKSVNLNEHDTPRFWVNFRLFCLGKIPMPKIAGDRRNDNKSSGLTGDWDATGGVQLHIEDDGKTLNIKLTASETLQSLNGKLTRRDEESDAKSFEGTLYVTFKGVAAREYKVPVTAKITAGNNLQLRCVDWPHFDQNGKYLGKKVMNVTWTRQ